METVMQSTIIKVATTMEATVADDHALTTVTQNSVIINAEKKIPINALTQTLIALTAITELASL